jgi:hypothetical protein
VLWVARCVKLEQTADRSLVELNNVHGLTKTGLGV